MPNEIKTTATKPDAENRAARTVIPSFDITCASARELTDAEVVEIVAGMPVSGSIYLSVEKVSIST